MDRSNPQNEKRKGRVWCENSQNRCPSPDSGLSLGPGPPFLGKYSFYRRTGKRPTMSERARRRNEPDQEQDPVPLPEPLALPAPNPEADMEVEPDATQLDDEETYPFPGAPENNSVLSKYKTHIARALWKGIERPILRPVYHTNKLLEWNIGSESSSSYFKQLWKATGLSMVPEMSYSGCDKNVITAFVERWHPETNSFHLPFWEMTITLDDVMCLTGLPIEGRSVRTSITGTRDVRQQMIDLFGMTERETYDGCLFGGSMKLEWLHSYFKTHIVDTDRDKVRQGCRAYLLYLFGCSLFCDKSGTKVPHQWLEYFADLKEFSKYAWGAATLAYLYRQLGSASKVDCRQLCGYLTLLQAWIYERFPCFRAAINVNYEVGQPLAYRWTTSRHAGPSVAHLQAHRETLDLMTADQVVWCPYGQDVRAHFPLSDISYYSGCLSAHDVVEPYYPERVLRQFGFVQTIPRDPVELSRHDSRAKAFLSAQAAYFDRWRDHVLRPEAFVGRAVPEWQYVGEYMEWYMRCSHPIIQNPENRSSGAWRNTTTTTDPWEMIRTACNVLAPDVGR
ncbi:hypothetical protein CASFOL_006175 [Castilleja foliolosa]|uniref:Aminotransferase-like plant mobile domain-containing protein n=1 Tax=Castilleja foliolosa TaxID=1961234 RepID=A0ABD3E6I8_9LAMI